MQLMIGWLAHSDQDVFSSVFLWKVWPSVPFSWRLILNVLQKETLTPVWSYDSPHPSDRWENSYGPGGIRQLPRVRDCTYSPSHCPSPGRTWTAHPGPRWKKVPPSGRPLANFPSTLLWNESWRLTSAGGSGNWVSVSTERTMRVSGWTRAAPSSGLLCFSQCICWWRGQPPSRPQWRRGRQSRKTSRRSRCTFYHRRVCHWGLLRCWRCKQWCQWCCSDLTRWKGRKGWRDGGWESSDWSVTAALMKPKNSHSVKSLIKHWLQVPHQHSQHVLITWGMWWIKVLTRFMIAPLMKHNMWPPEPQRASPFHYQSSALTWLLTCSDEENASAQEDVVGLVVNSAHPDTEPTQHQQAGAEDGKHAGGADDTCAEIIDNSELLEKMDSVLKPE